MGNLTQLEAGELVQRLKERLGQGDAGEANRFEVRDRKIGEPLDLSGLKLPFPVVFTGCELDVLCLEDCDLDTLRITNTTCAGIDGDRLKARGLQLDQGFRCTGTVFLPEARIEGDLNCGGSTFENPGNLAICLDGARVGGRVFLRRANCRGAVTAINARVEGGLSANGSEFAHAGKALDLERIQVNGRVYMLEARLHGALSMAGAKIASDVHLERMSVDDVPRDRAGIDLDRITVDGRVVLRGVVSSGRTRLRNATVGKDVELHGARLRGDGDGALAMTGAVVHGRIDLRDKVEADGGVKLVGCRIDGDVLLGHESSIEAGSTTPGLDLSRARVDGSLRLVGSLRGAPALGLATTRVSGDIDLRGAHVASGPKPLDAYPGPVAIKGEGLVVEGTVLASDLHADGIVALRRLRVTGDVYFGRATFTHRVGLDSAAISGRLLLDRIRLSPAEGHGLTLVGAVVDGRFHWEPRDIADGTPVDLARMRVAYLDDVDTKWPTDGLELDGFAYGDIHDIESSDSWIAKRLGWIRGYTRRSFSPQPYENLLEVLRRGGHESHARTVARAKQDDLRRYGQLPAPARLGNWLLGLLLGHGYAIWRALLLAAAFVAVGAIVFWLGEDAGQLASAAPKAPDFVAPAYSLDMLLPIVDLNQADARPPLRGISLYYSWGQIVAGWALATLIGLGLTGLVKKD
jgi:hypothetical protein